MEKENEGNLIFQTEPYRKAGGSEKPLERRRREKRLPTNMGPNLEKGLARPGKRPGSKEKNCRPVGKTKNANCWDARSAVPDEKLETRRLKQIVWHREEERRSQKNSVVRGPYRE